MVEEKIRVCKQAGLKPHTKYKLVSQLIGESISRKDYKTIVSLIQETHHVMSFFVFFPVLGSIEMHCRLSHGCSAEDTLTTSQRFN